MAYTPNPGSFSLFKNERKEKDSHPDYKGDGKDLNGNDVWVSAWLKDGTKGKFMSCSMQLKTASSPAPAPTATPKPAPNFSDMDDDIPF